MLQLRLTVATLVILIIMTVNGKVIEKPNSSRMSGDVNAARQLEFLTGVGKETSTPNFIRLVIMRFIYGLATSMGVEDRLEGLFNGAFVPPNADGDLFGLGGFGGGDGSDSGDYGDLSALDGLFGDDGL